MQRLRDLIGSAAGSPEAYDGPGSRYAVGERTGARDRTPNRLVPTEVSPDLDTARQQAGRGETSRPTRGERSDRAARGPVEGPPEWEARAGLMAALRSPSSLRTAILLREVLDAPVALRDDPRQR